MDPFRIFLLSLWLIPLDFDTSGGRENNLLAVRRSSEAVTTAFVSITVYIHIYVLYQKMYEVVFTQFGGEYRIDI